MQAKRTDKNNGKVKLGKKKVKKMKVGFTMSSKG